MKQRHSCATIPTRQTYFEEACGVWDQLRPGVRHRGKIESTINNAKRALALRTAHGSLAAYFWRWEPGARSRPRRVTRDMLARLGPPSEATALSRDLKRRGWTFVGPTTLYAFMQAMGMVNDHLDGCSCRRIVEQARTSLARPHLAR